MDRRGFLKKLSIGAGVAAIPAAIVSEMMSSKDEGTIGLFEQIRRCGNHYPVNFMEGNELKDQDWVKITGGY